MFVKQEHLYIVLISYATSLAVGAAVTNLTSRTSCRSNQWRCADGTCIPVDGKCDGKFDCSDKSDETHALCRKNKPAPPGYCVLPPYPDHGRYVVTNSPQSRPGQYLPFALINVTCDEGYGVIGSNLVSCGGLNSQPIPKCIQLRSNDDIKRLPSFLRTIRESPNEIPCKPQPCGPNSECREINNQAVCSCLPSFLGTPPSCRPECSENEDCQQHQACLNQKCLNPCIEACGVGATCVVIRHNPICSCPASYTGDPFVKCSYVTELPDKHSCETRACGPNSECREINNQAVCSCLPSFVGMPPSCRPECSENEDCQQHQACLNQKCYNPCYETCGVGATCVVIRHNPICSCPASYTGDPFVMCRYFVSETTESISVPYRNPFQRQCKLEPHDSVQYNCILLVGDGTRPCNQYEPPGTTVEPQCKPNHFSNNRLYMKCNENGEWNRIVICEPECGRVTPSGDSLIFGGAAAKRGELPWYAAIYHKPTALKDFYQLICGGTIISNNVVLSAAHCFWDNFGEKDPSLFAVATAKLFREWDSKNDKDVQKSNITSIVFPDHYFGALANEQQDIAILMLETPFVYHNYVRRVCLDFSRPFSDLQLQEGNLGKVAGFGLTTAQASMGSPILKAVSLPYVPIRQCRKLTPDSFAENLSGDKICAGYSDGTAALCKGDSGGGLSFPAQERGAIRYYLRGIVSTAPRVDDACNTYTVITFTSIIEHERFINKYL